MLAAEGLAVLRPGHGAQVAAITVQDFVEINELRLLVEPGVARIAAGRARGLTISNLIRRLVTSEESVQMDASTLASLDFEAHVAIAEAAANRRVTALVRRLNELNGLARPWDVRQRSGEILHSISEILVSIELGDGAAAEAQMRRHIGAFISAYGSNLANGYSESGRQSDDAGGVPLVQSGTG